MRTKIFTPIRIAVRWICSIVAVRLRMDMISGLRTH